MIVEHRDPTIKYPRAVKDEKMRLVFDWLLEFRFSSIEILSKRLGSNAVNTNRFFNSLIKDGFIQSFKNVNTKNDRYVMLRQPGVEVLSVIGRDVNHAVTRSQHLGRYSQIMHDVAVQEAILNRIDQFEEVIWDKNIQGENLKERPDALLKSGKGYWIALEYERWRKDSKRIFYTFAGHCRSLTEGKFKGVIYLFDKEVDQQHYQKLFNEVEWPVYKKEPKSGKMVRLANEFKPDDVSGLRSCFTFNTA